MTQYDGLDVADEETSVCVVDQEGAVLVDAKVASEPAMIAAFIRARASRAPPANCERHNGSCWYTERIAASTAPMNNAAINQSPSVSAATNRVCSAARPR
jgi:transposase